MRDRECDPAAGVVSRRNFLKLGGATLVTVTLPVYLRKAGLPSTLRAQQVEYPRQTIGRLSELSSGEPIGFDYPWDHPAATNFLIKLSEPAGGGVGPDQDVVAFNSFCPHQGGPLTGQFHDDIGVAGPCPLHWSTFDLTRHGMVISGHATQGLPQIILETDGDDIIATGVLGLIFSYHDNRVDPGG
ncbi:MAG: arsenate reductase (azurin) small subunit [Candidatus Promineifilaceae bacterium]